MADLNDKITTIKGIGEKKAQAFGRLGVFSLYDLISFFPRRYEDRSLFKPIALCEDGETCCVSAIIADDPRLVYVRRGMELVKLRIADESGVADVTYFNQPYMKNNLRRGEEFIFFGKMDVKGARRSMANPVAERQDSPNRVTGCIMPVYPLTNGLNQKSVVQSVKIGLDECGELVPEIVPDDILKRNKLCKASFAYRSIHFPADFESLELARRRFIFEELFTLSCALGCMRKDRSKQPGIKISDADVSPFISSLPFTPTGAQLRAINDAIADMSSGNAMSRLVQGDVGSGKTLVAAALFYVMNKNGYSCAFMAPTEILAKQHVKTMTELLSPFGIKVDKLTGSMTAKEKSAVKQALKSGETGVLVGTHALFSEGVDYSHLGLVITDEQHRFGVAQRASLISKGECPHVLVMSATPIPRTLALIIYGDLDVSIIDEMPPGRQKVSTFAVDETYRSRLNGFIKKQADEGHQVYIVCPKVEDDEESDGRLKSAEEHCRAVAASIPGIRAACVHGRLKAKEKEAIMQSFSKGEIDVLVSTTVIEVGVDVPNATLMVIENAERFGLSQLHQLRGRVGRGSAKSWCILVSDNKSDEVKARLDIMCKTNDGFKISEEDLRLRGPGDFFGSRQHGLPEMHIADLGADTAALKHAQDEAKSLLASDPDLSLPEHRNLKNRISAIFSDSGDSFN